MIRCGLYIRVSTDMQKERGESLEVQLKRLNAYVDSKENWAVVETYKDAGISAKNTNRLEFSRMKADIEQGKLDVILCTKLDRLFRNTKDFLDTTDYFEQKNVMFVCLEGSIDTTNPAGRVFSTMRAAFGQFERETTAERVRDVMKSRAEDGKYNGGIAPFGYSVENKNLVINPDEGELIKEIYQLYLERRSILFVTHKLNDEGKKTRKGELWAPVSIRRILTTPTYYGEFVYNKRSHTYRGELKRNAKEKFIRGMGKHEPLISKEIFDQVQEIIRQQARLAPRKTSKYLLSGLVFCKLCGSRMQGHLSRKNHAYYTCNGHTHKGNAKCVGNAIRVDTLESRITENLKSLSINQDSLEIALKETCFTNDKNAGVVSKRLKILQDQLGKSQIKRDKIFELFEGNHINKSEFLERKKLIDDEEEAINKEMDVLKGKLSMADSNSYDLDATIGLCKDMKEVYDELDITDRKELVCNLLTEIDVDKHWIDYSIQILPKVISPVQSLGLCASSSDTGMHSHQNHPQPIRLWFRISRYSEETLGAKIRKYRLENGLKQIELADKLGVTEATIGNWELDRTKPRKPIKSISF